VNNTQKLDDIRRRLRVTDVRLAVIQRAAVVIFERATGRPVSSQSLFSDDEQALRACGGCRSRVLAEAGGKSGPR
jgi:hypothetical protein